MIQAQQNFKNAFGCDGDIYFAPGRVNLIGEHTDYNGGYVFPCALNFGTYLVIRKRNDSKIILKSSNFPHTVKVDITELAFDCQNGWANYPIGIIVAFKELGAKICGMEMMFTGNIPSGAGLSSSASIELATAVAMNDIFKQNMSMLKMVELSQKVENQFIGVSCGIMDQFAVGMGMKDSAIFLNCKNMKYEYVPLKLNNCRIVISNTNKKRSLADSKYNQRYDECMTAVKMLKLCEIDCLGDLSIKEFEINKHNISDEAILKRAEHVVCENARTLKAVELLNANDIEGFGDLMIQSHNSLRDLYEVTGVELDTLVEEALKTKGVYGSRMTGAGFGGCTVSLVECDSVEFFINRVGENYFAKTGIKADFYIAEAGGGAEKIYR